jgi:phage shock protein A
MFTPFGDGRAGAKTAPKASIHTEKRRIERLAQKAESSAAKFNLRYEDTFGLAREAFSRGDIAQYENLTDLALSYKTASDSMRKNSVSLKKMAAELENTALQEETAAIVNQVNEALNASLSTYSVAGVQRTAAMFKRANENIEQRGAAVSKALEDGGGRVDPLKREEMHEKIADSAGAGFGQLFVPIAEETLQDKELEERFTRLKESLTQV